VEIKSQEDKIKRLENLTLTPGKSTDNDSDKENIWREKLEDQAISNNHLEAQLKLQVHERKLLLEKSAFSIFNSILRSSEAHKRSIFLQ